MVALRADHPLSRLVASLGKIARDQGQFAAIRVQAHTGEAWNELADVISKYATQHGELGNPDFEWLQEIAKKPALVEWWPTLCHNARAAALPEMSEGSMVITQIPEPIAAPFEQPQLSTVDTHQLRLNVTSYNVLSLLDDGGIDATGRRGGHKSSRVDIQLHQRAIHVAGMQEARMQEGVSYTEHYKILSTGAVAPNAAKQFGCEIWFHRTRSWLKDSEVPLQHTQLAVLCSEPRLLIIRADNSLGVWFFVAGHTPKNTNTHEEVGLWWNKLHQQLHHIPSGAHVVLMLDTNVTLGSLQSEGISDYGQQAPNGASCFLERCVEDHELFCPATFEHIHTGPHGTWRHPLGTWTRIDYVIVSKGLQRYCRRSAVWRAFDGGYAHDDHIPTVLESARISWRMPGGSPNAL